MDTPFGREGSEGSKGSTGSEGGGGGFAANFIGCSAAVVRPEIWKGGPPPPPKGGIYIHCPQGNP
jgi:hypothetical protein